MKKFHSGDIKAHKNHHEAAKNHIEFFWSFIKKVTKNKEKTYWDKYQFSVKECVTEEIYETHGIIIIQEEGHYKYLLPKNENNFKLLMWMQENCKCKNKILQRTHIGYYHSTPSTQERDRIREFLENKKKEKEK